MDIIFLFNQQERKAGGFSPTIKASSFKEGGFLSPPIQTKNNTKQVYYQ